MKPHIKITADVCIRACICCAGSENVLVVEIGREITPQTSHTSALGMCDRCRDDLAMALIGDGPSFPCGYDQSEPMPAIPTLRGPMINSALGTITTEEARGIIADMLRSCIESDRG